MKSVYRNLVSFEEAVEKAFQNITTVSGEEVVDVKDSAGRILSRDVLAPRNNPPFHRSTMDGFAVRSEDVAGADQENPISLKITGESFIGEARKIMHGSGNCFRISTGAIVPENADAVVRVESTSASEGTVQIMESVEPSENIAESGSDVAYSEVLMLSGKEIETSDIAVLASLGISKVSVHRKLRVRVISTGNELVSYDEPYHEGSINDANGIVLASELNSFPTVEATYFGIVRDNYSEIRGRIMEGLDGNDVIILSGGSSAGESDLVYRIIEELDPGIVFHGVLVKPGLPTVLGRKGNKAIIGLPGFPVSALMIFRSIFLRPLLAASHSTRLPMTAKASLSSNLRLEMGKQNLVPVRVSGRGEPRIYPVAGLSGSISRFTGTSGFISVAGNAKYIEAGTSLEVTLWENIISYPETVISGLIFHEVYDPLRNEKPAAYFQRMLPRDSLRSLKNGDSDASVFLVTEDYLPTLRKTEEFPASGVEIMAAPPVKLGIAFRDSPGKIGNIPALVRNGTRLAGPSLRFLTNIITGNRELTTLLSAMESNVSGYETSGLKESVELLGAGKADLAITTGKLAEGKGLSFIGIADLYTVCLLSVKSAENLSEVLKTDEMSAID